jgi:hypothetical protein
MSRAPDRGGGRESKKGSLRKSKVNAADAAKKAHCKPREEQPETSLPPPPVAPLPAQRARTGSAAVAPSSTASAAALRGPFLDGFANLISRQFDRDREAVLRRAREARTAPPAACLPRCARFSRGPRLRCRRV